MSATEVTASGRAKSRPSRAGGLLEAFVEPIKPVRTSPLYMLGLPIAALAMVILPLIYISLIAVVAYGVFYHATENAATLSAAGLRGRLLVYVTPLVVGGILVLFMIKPLFARQSRSDNRFSLEPSNEPLLFEFVTRLCKAMRAPVPRRIDVDCNVNASASLRRGLLSMFGRDLVLTIGLPLVAGLNLRQLTGVMAHEFGHFTQGMAMRLTYIIRSVNFWFARVVYERDSWDDQLVEYSEDSDWRLQIILYIARFFVWLTRKILWVLMMTGHVISCWLMRQMEYDADRHQARVVGSETFAPTVSRLHLLSLATQGAYADLRGLWNDRTLVNNLPILIVANLDQIPKHVRTEIVDAIEKRKTGLLDTHPSDRSRIENARREEAPGIFRVESPASVLFANFEAVCRAATRTRYEELMGAQMGGAKLISVEQVVGRKSGMRQQQDALVRYFGQTVSLARPFVFASAWIDTPKDPDKTIAELKRAREQIQRALPKASKLYRDIEKADGFLIDATRAATLLQAGLKIEAKDFHLPKPTKEAADLMRDKALAAIKSLGTRLEPFERTVQIRLLSALGLLNTPAIAARVSEAQALRETARRVAQALAALGSTRDSLLELRKDMAQFQVIVRNLEANPKHGPLLEAVRRTATRLRRNLIALQEPLGHAPYPFEHAQANVSTSQYAIEYIPGEDDLGSLFGTAGEAMEKLNTIYFRCLAQISLIAENVETALGLSPLVIPADPGEAGADDESGVR